MFEFLRRRARKGPARPSLHWDIHSHLLPNVDDGVRTFDDSIECIRGLQMLGYSGSIVTPHIYKGLYPNTRESVEPVFAELRIALADAGLTYELQLAAEYFADEHLIELARQGTPLLSFPADGRSCVLLEFPYQSEPLLWADALSALHRGGYSPVLAHVERYKFVTQNSAAWLERFTQFDVMFQCNIGSLVGQYGRESMEFARAMLSSGRVTFWGTDLHRAKQVDHFIAPGLTHLDELGELNPLLRR